MKWVGEWDECVYEKVDEMDTWMNEKMDEWVDAWIR